MAGLLVPTIVSGRSLMLALLALMSASAFFTSLMVDPSVDLFRFHKMSSQPAGATNELKELSRLPVRVKGG